MFLDEKLLQIEAEKNKREKQEKRFQEIKEDISQQEREQKTVEDRIRELDCKLVEIKGKNFVCKLISTSLLTMSKSIPKSKNGSFLSLLTGIKCRG